MKKPTLLPVPVNAVYYKNCVSNELLNSTPEVSFDETIREQGYKLNISGDGIKITAADKAGAFYAEQTLKQLRKQYTNNDCPACDIDDYPKILWRCIALDYSRDKNMRFEDILDFVDMISSWKINAFSLYMEHTFAFKDHKTVWEDASPLTAEQIHALDAYCKERFIDLAPKLETLGHMERWLMHEPYRKLAECPQGVKSSWQIHPDGPFSLCPTDPEALKFMKSLLDEFLPNFSSKYFLGCGDETYDIGKGRSKEICEKIGVNKVYGDWFHKIGEFTKANGKTLLLDSDMIKSNPAAIACVPEDTILMEWGYGRQYPFAKNAKDFKKLNRKFCFCSSNSGYSCTAGRTYRWRGNIANAAENAIKSGAFGFACYEFGDLGYWTQFSFSLPGFAYAAAMSWDAENNKFIDLADFLDKFVFNCEGLGDFIIDLGKVYHASATEDDHDAYHLMLSARYNRKGEAPTENMNLDNIAKTEEDIYQLKYRFSRLKNVPESIAEEVNAALKWYLCLVHVAREYFLDENARYLFEMLPSVQHKLAPEFEDAIRDLLAVRDKYYCSGGRKIAIHWLKFFWETIFRVVPFPELPEIEK